MRTYWNKLHTQFKQSARSPQSAREFAELKKMTPLLDRFADPAALLDYLGDKSGDLDAKDAIYAVLVKAVQGGSAGKGVASTLLWLGLWPVLFAIYRSRQQEYRGEQEELVSEIGEAFSAAVARADLARIARVVATLLLNTERNLGEQQQRRRKVEQRKACEVELSTVPLAVEAPASGLSVAAEIEAVHRWLERVIGGEDADLVVSVAILGECQFGMGKKMGIAPKTAQKRYERAMAKLRSEISQ